jgi:excisionase family DNA binding protein
VDEAAELLSVHRTTIWRWIESGRLQSIKLGGCRRIRPEAIEALLDGAAA